METATKFLKWLCLVVLALTGFAVALSLWLRWPVYHERWYAQSDWSSWDEKKVAALGQFGDSYGAFNALFSGLAFVAITITLLLQMREMHHQRREFEEARKRDHETELRRRTIELFEEFHSLHMNDMRSTADLFLWDHPGDNLDRLYDTHRKKADAVWMVIQFYQRLWFGIKLKHIEAAKVPELFGEVFVWWYTVYLADRLMPTNWELARSVQHLYDWLVKEAGQSEPFKRWSARAVLEKETRRMPSPNGVIAGERAADVTAAEQRQAAPGTLG